MMSRLQVFEQFLHDRLNEATDLARSIARRTADAVRSLQFEDIVRQISEHSTTTALKLDHFVVESGAIMTRYQASDYETAAEQLSTAADTLKRALPRKPAVQQDMSGGDVELF
jgi:methyl-accepting chemotaxis protein